LHGTFIDTGAPHVVIFESGLERLDVMEFGRAIRRDPRFNPAGTTSISSGYGTGARWSSAHMNGGWSPRPSRAGQIGRIRACQFGPVHTHLSVAVAVRSGETLFVYFKKTGDGWTDVFLEGSAHMLFKGRLLYHEDQSIIRLTP